MLYKYLNSKKGFTLMELFVVIIILGVLVAIAVPVFDNVIKKQREDDCRNQRLVLETTVKQAMYGMIDNGEKQPLITFKCTNITAGDLDGYNVIANEQILDKVEQYDFDGDGVEENCFKFTADENCFTFAELRGGYRPGTAAGFMVQGLDAYKDGCDEGYYLKKIKYQMENGGKGTPFYMFLDNQELPVCPFADKTNSQGYYYYVLEDGTVRCGCEFDADK